MGFMRYATLMLNLQVIPATRRYFSDRSPSGHVARKVWLVQDARTGMIVGQHLRKSDADAQAATGRA